MAGILSYGCGQIIPEAIVCEGNVLPEEKPRLLFFDVAREDYVELAYQAVKRKLAVALCGVSEVNIQHLLGMGPMAQRNACALAVLGSWRYVPAIAAIKEIVGTGCLGRVGKLSTNPVEGRLASLRIADIAGWVGAELNHGALQSSFGLKMELEGDNGWIHVECTLDGQDALFESCLLGHRRNRIIPKANPQLSELAILAMSLPAEGRIKKLPMMMTL